MNTPFPFDGMLVFAFLSLLLLGVGLRARFRLFQQFLVPSCLIGGLVGLGLMHSGMLTLDCSVLEIETTQKCYSADCCKLNQLIYTTVNRGKLCRD